MLRMLTFTLAFGGLVLSGYLLYLHTVDMGGGVMPRLCGGAFDCSTVLQSSYATIGGQIPIASLGVLYFALVAVWILFVGRLPGRLHHACVWPALLATVGMVESIHLIYIMGWKLHAWCSFCLATHAVNILLCAGLWGQWLGGCRARDDEEILAESQRQIWKIPALTFLTGCSLAVSLLAVGGAALFANKYARTAAELETIQLDPAYGRWVFLRTPVEAAVQAVAEDDPVRGPADAAHTVVMFGDFQCRFCAIADEALRQVQEKLPLRLVFRHYPYSHLCNAAVGKTNMHAFACQAAEAAEAALRVGGNDAFWRMHDVLYENRNRLAERPYAELARQIGLDPTAFAEAMRDPTLRRRIDRDTNLGKTLKIEGTPVLFLNGRRVTLDVVFKDTSGSEIDQDRTVELWRNLIASADAAAATQPAITHSPASQPLASVEE
jgi:protein-disulfide isomerase/uncharacterized membrane protein